MTNEIAEPTSAELNRLIHIDNRKAANTPGGLTEELVNAPQLAILELYQDDNYSEEIPATW